MSCILMWEDKKLWTFSLEEVLLWIMNQKPWFKDINWWTGVVWIIVMFLSAVWTHSDGTHSLQRIHCWASDVKLNFSKSVLIKKQTHRHLWWPESKYIFSKFKFLGFFVKYFHLNYSLKCGLIIQILFEATIVHLLPLYLNFFHFLFPSLLLTM